MSDRGGAQPARIWRCYATDMVEAAEKIVTYTAGMTQAELLGNDMAFDATVRNLEVIGEAARRIPDEGSRASQRHTVGRHRRYAQSLGARVLLGRRRCRLASGAGRCAIPLGDAAPHLAGIRR